MTTTTQQIRQAIDHLRSARDLLKSAGAPKTVHRVRLAISSAGGALRHAELAPIREERQAGEATEPGEGPTP